MRVAEFSEVASGKDDRRPGFQAALLKCRQLAAALVAARQDRITGRAKTLSQLLEEGYAIRAMDMPSADDLMMQIYAAMAQKEGELVSERTSAGLRGARARGTRPGGNRSFRPIQLPSATAAAVTRTLRGGQAAFRLRLEIQRFPGKAALPLWHWKPGPLPARL